MAETSSLNPGQTEAPPGEDWSCLDAVEPPPLATAVAGTRIVYSLQAVDLGTKLPYTRGSLRACGITDVECTRPVVGPLESDRDGWFDIPLSEGFTGYFEVTGPDVMSGVFILPEPVRADTAVPYPYLTLSFAVLESLGGVLGVPVEPESGLVSVRALDCKSVPAPGVALSKSGAGVPWYFVGGLPSVNVRATSSDGLGGFANAPVGVAQVDAMTPDGESIMGSLSMLLRPGWSTTSFMRPPGASRVTP